MAPGLLAAVLLFGVLPPAMAADFSYGQRLYSIGDYAGALKIWRLLAEDGDTRAQYSMALMYLKGMGVPQDNEKARFWAEKSAAGNFGPAKALLTMLGDSPQTLANKSRMAAGMSTTSAADRDTPEGRAQLIAEGVLHQLAGQSGRFGDLRYGGAVVASAGEGFDVSIMDVALKGPQETLDIGTVVMNVQTRDERYDLVRMRLPEVLYLRGDKGTLSRIALGHQNSEIIWDNTLATSTVFSLVLGALQITADGKPGQVNIGRIAVTAGLKPDGLRWSGPFAYEASDIKALSADKNVTVSIGRMGLNVDLEGFDLPRYLQAVQGLRPGRERAGEPSDRFVDILRRFRVTFHLADIEAPNAGDRPFSLRRADISVAYADQGNDTAQMRLDLQHSGLTLARVAEADEWAPETMTLGLRIDRLPIRTATLALVTLGVDLALFGEVTLGDELIARLQRDLAESGASMHLEHMEVAGIGVRGQAQGQLLSDTDAAFGATGALTFRVAGLETLIENHDDSKEDPVREYAQMIASMAEPDPAAGGRRIELVLSKSGELFLNGKPFQLFP